MQKQNPNRIRNILILLVLIILACCCLFLGLPLLTTLLSGDGLTVDQPGQPSFSGNTITYEVTGTGTNASVSYSPPDGGMAQEDVTLPWSKDFDAEIGDVLSLTASTGTETAEITCTIKVNGEVFKTVTSSGQFVFASCAGVLGLD